MSMSDAESEAGGDTEYVGSFLPWVEDNPSTDLLVVVDARVLHDFLQTTFAGHDDVDEIIACREYWCSGRFLLRKTSTRMFFAYEKGGKVVDIDVEKGKHLVEEYEDCVASLMMNCRMKSFQRRCRNYNDDNGKLELSVRSFGEIWSMQHIHVVAREILSLLTDVNGLYQYLKLFADYQVVDIGSMELSVVNFQLLKSFCRNFNVAGFLETDYADCVGTLQAWSLGEKSGALGVLRDNHAHILKMGLQGFQEYHEIEKKLRQCNDEKHSTRHQLQLQSKKSREDINILKAKSTHLEALAVQQVKHIESMRQQHHNQIQTLRAEHDGKIKQYTKVAGDALTKIQELEQSKQKLTKHFHTEIEKLQKDKKQNVAGLDALMLRFSNEVTMLERKEDAMKKQIAASEAEIRKLNTQYDQLSAQLAAALQREISVTRQLEITIKNNARQKKDEEAKLQHLQETLEKALKDGNESDSIETLKPVIVQQQFKIQQLETHATLLKTDYLHKEGELKILIEKQYLEMKELNKQWSARIGLQEQKYKDEIALKNEEIKRIQDLQREVLSAESPIPSISSREFSDDLSSQDSDIESRVSSDSDNGSIELPQSVVVPEPTVDVNVEHFQPTMRKFLSALNQENADLLDIAGFNELSPKIVHFIQEGKKSSQYDFKIFMEICMQIAQKCFKREYSRFWDFFLAVFNDKISNSDNEVTLTVVLDTIAQISGTVWDKFTFQNVTRPKAMMMYNGKLTHVDNTADDYITDEQKDCLCRAMHHSRFGKLLTSFQLSNTSTKFMCSYMIGVSRDSSIIYALIGRESGMNSLHPLYERKDNKQHGIKDINNTGEITKDSPSDQGPDSEIKEGGERADGEIAGKSPSVPSLPAQVSTNGEQSMSDQESGDGGIEEERPSVISEGFSDNSEKLINFFQYPINLDLEDIKGTMLKIENLVYDAGIRDNKDEKRKIFQKMDTFDWKFVLEVCVYYVIYDFTKGNSSTFRSLLRNCIKGTEFNVWQKIIDLFNTEFDFSENSDSKKINVRIKDVFKQILLNSNNNISPVRSLKKNHVPEMYFVGRWLALNTEVPKLSTKSARGILQAIKSGLFGKVIKTESLKDNAYRYCFCLAIDEKCIFTIKGPRTMMELSNTKLNQEYNKLQHKIITNLSEFDETATFVDEGENSNTSSNENGAALTDKMLDAVQKNGQDAKLASSSSDLSTTPSQVLTHAAAGCEPDVYNYYDFQYHPEIFSAKQYFHGMVPYNDSAHMMYYHVL